MLRMCSTEVVHIALPINSLKVLAARILVGDKYKVMSDVPAGKQSECGYQVGARSKRETSAPSYPEDSAIDVLLRNQISICCLDM